MEPDRGAVCSSRCRGGPVDAGDPDAVEEIGEDATGAGRFSPRSLVRSGENVEFVVDVANMQFFDPDSRLAVWG